jgi:hypothetical protein
MWGSGVENPSLFQDYFVRVTGSRQVMPRDQVDAMSRSARVE